MSDELLDDNEGGLSISLSNSLSFPCPSFLLQIIITTILFQAYTYSWMMLLIVLYDDAVLVWMTWYSIYIDASSVTTIRDDVRCKKEECIVQ